MNDEEIEYEPGPHVTELSGDEDAADAATFAAACARLRLYTSQPYLIEAGSLLGRLADAFGNWPEANRRLGAQTLSEWSLALSEQQAAFDRGLALLDAGYTAAAYASLADAIVDGLEPTDPRDERHLSLRYIVDEIGPSLSALGERLGAMAACIHTTLTAGWAYPLLLAEPPAPETETPAMYEDDTTVLTGHAVPKTGIWMPTAIRYGCPNFLIAGQMAAPMTRAGTRYDYAASDGGGLEPPKEAWTAYDYVQEETEWRLVWYDKRYHAGLKK